VCIAPIDRGTDTTEIAMSIQERHTSVPTTQNTATPAAAPRSYASIAWGVVRIIVGWMFLWAFVDKLFGLGFATPSARSWLNGGSPTKGFLSSSADGPFAGFYRSIAGAPWADWLFMLGLLGIGLALVLGIGIRIAAASGVVLYLMMWSVVLPPTTNPVVDDHILGAAVLVGLALAHAGNTLGFGKLWARIPLVQRTPWLR
jgi:thiosulfate dehydrogenase [quinone] large subunit